MTASTSRNDYRLGYRPDVEGLRAVAILLVVAAHANVAWLAGGYVGVDVFYVLSGYLITGLLVQEAATQGRLRFAVFYGRRLRRLLPALLLMMLVTCVAAWLLMPPSGLSAQASAAGSAALWLSNFHFALWNMDYFAPAAKTNLFLHTWSLGVEEQFYLVWPLLIMLAMGAFKHAPFVRSSARLKWLFGGMAVASFAACLVLTYRAPHFAFYMMPTRAWQFALGALVFLATGAPAFRADAGFPQLRWLRHFGWLGLAMIVATAAWITDSVPYPGTWSLLPTIGAALVLAAGSQAGNWGLGAALSARPMQALGKVSYSWYLWHWPVLVLGATVLAIENPWNRLWLVVLSLAIAAVSYHWFETPIRHNRKLLAKPRIAVVAALGVMLVAMVAARQWQQAAPAAATGPVFARLAAAHNDAPPPNAMGCHAMPDVTYAKTCAFGDPHAPHTAVLMGDSIAEAWFPALRKVLEQPGWRFLSITKSGCPMVAEPLFDSLKGRYYTQCTAWRRDALRKVAQLRPDLVVLSSFQHYPLTLAQWRQGTTDVLRRLSASAKRVYLVRSAPLLPFEGPSCLEPRGRVYRALVNASHCTAPAYTPEGNAVFATLRAAATPFANVSVLDLTDAICPGGVCAAERDGEVVFRDSHHMTATFAATLAPELGKALGLEPAPARVTTAARASGSTSMARH